MTDSTPDILPPVPSDRDPATPPPVPAKKPSFWRRLFTSKRREQALAMQNGVGEMVELIRAIRAHLDRQEIVQSHALSLFEKLPQSLDQQHELMGLLKEQVDAKIASDKELTESMAKLSGTLASIDETQKASSKTVTDMINRSRESEQLLREVIRRSERRMTIMILLVLAAAAILAYTFGRSRAVPASEAPAAAAVVEEQAVAEEPAAEPIAEEKAEAPAEKPAIEEKTAEKAPETPAIAPKAEEKPVEKPAKKAERTPRKPRAAKAVEQAEEKAEEPAAKPAEKPARRPRRMRPEPEKAVEPVAEPAPAAAEPAAEVPAAPASLPAAAPVENADFPITTDALATP